MHERHAWRGVTASAPRELVALHPALDARYTSLVASVAADVEASLSPAVAANRLASWATEPPILGFRPWRDERAEFAERLRRLAESGACLVLSDVRDCYRSIRPNVVGRALRASGCDAIASGRTVAFLRRLEETGIVGLPVGPEPSPVLANAVLASVDRSIAAAGYRHVRWVDDVVVAVGEPEHADRALAIVRSASAALGLELNERKTRVLVDPSSLGDGSAISLALGPETSNDTDHAKARAAMPVG